MLVPACTAAPSSAPLLPTSLAPCLLALVTCLLFSWPRAPGYPAATFPSFLPIDSSGTSFLWVLPLLPWYVWPHPPMHADFYRNNLDFFPVLPTQNIFHNLHADFCAWRAPRFIFLSFEFSFYVWSLAPAREPGPEYDTRRRWGILKKTLCGPTAIHLCCSCIDIDHCIMHRISSRIHDYLVGLPVSIPWYGYPF